MIDLILKDIEDRYVRENFFRLSRFINDQLLLTGDFKLFEISIPAKDLDFEVLHGLTFIPTDIVVLSVEGDHNFYFKYQNFTDSSFFIEASGAVKIKFLGGRLKSNQGFSVTERPILVSPIVDLDDVLIDQFYDVLVDNEYNILVDAA